MLVKSVSEFKCTDHGQNSSTSPSDQLNTLTAGTSNLNISLSLFV